MHGKQSIAIFDRQCPLFRDCPETAPVARYHSLEADPVHFPAELRITAQTADGEIMAVQHRDFPIFGMQFHPESIMTPAVSYTHLAQTQLQGCLYGIYR